MRACASIELCPPPAELASTGAGTTLLVCLAIWLLASGVLLLVGRMMIAFGMDPQSSQSSEGGDRV